MSENFVFSVFRTYLEYNHQSPPPWAVWLKLPSSPGLLTNMAITSSLACLQLPLPHFSLFSTQWQSDPVNVYIRSGHFSVQVHRSLHLFKSKITIFTMPFYNNLSVTSEGYFSGLLGYCSFFLSLLRAKSLTQRSTTSLAKLINLGDDRQIIQGSRMLRIWCVCVCVCARMCISASDCLVGAVSMALESQTYEWRSFLLDVWLVIQYSWVSVFFSI